MATYRKRNEVTVEFQVLGKTLVIKDIKETRPVWEKGEYGDRWVTASMDEIALLQVAFPNLEDPMGLMAAEVKELRRQLSSYQDAEWYPH